MYEWYSYSEECLQCNTKNNYYTYELGQTSCTGCKRDTEQINPLLTQYGKEEYCNLMRQEDWEMHPQEIKDDYVDKCGSSPCVTRCLDGEYKTAESSVCVGCSEGWTEGCIEQ